MMPDTSSGGYVDPDHMSAEDKAGYWDALMALAPADGDEHGADRAAVVDTPMGQIVRLPSGDTRTRYPEVDWHELFSDEQTEPEWGIEPLFEFGQYVSVFAKAGDGKSLIFQEIMAAFAAGRPVLGNPAREPLDVLYLDYENSKRDLRERFGAFEYTPDELARLHYLWLPGMPPLDTPEGAADLQAAVAAYSARVVVIDTAVRVIEGKEDAADTWKDMYRLAISPLKAAGVTVIRLDHPGKDAERGARGSSGKEGDVDHIWWLRYDRKTRVVSLKHMKDRPGSGTEEISYTRVSGPLRHDPGQVFGGPDWRALQAAATLDDLGAPAGLSRDAARAFLIRKKHPEKFSNQTLASAVRLRKSREVPSARHSSPSPESDDLASLSPERNGQDETAGQTVPDSPGTTGQPDRGPTLSGCPPVPVPYKGTGGQPGQDPTPTTTGLDHPDEPQLEDVMPNIGRSRCRTCSWPIIDITAGCARCRPTTPPDAA